MDENEKEKLQNIIDRLVLMERYMKRLNTDLYNYHTLTEDDRASLSFEYERFLKNLTWLRMEIAEIKNKEVKELKEGMNLNDKNKYEFRK